AVRVRIAGEVVLGRSRTHPTRPELWSDRTVGRLGLDLVTGRFGETAEDTVEVCHIAVGDGRTGAGKETAQEGDPRDRDDRDGDEHLDESVASLGRHACVVAGERQAASDETGNLHHQPDMVTLLPPLTTNPAQIRWPVPAPGPPCNVTIALGR